MTEFKYGLFSSFILFIWMIIEYTLLIPNFYHIGFYLSMLAIAIPIAGIYMGIREKRMKTNFGYITFNDAFKTGMIITVIITLMVIIFIYVYYEFINPQYLNYLAAETEKKMLQNNFPRDEINATLTIVKYNYSLNIQILQKIIITLIGGTIISAIVSLILKKERKIKPASERK